MSPTLQSAIKLHQKGNLQEAEKYYRIILSQEDSLHVHYLIGLLYSQQKKYIRAILHLEKSSAIQRVNPDWYNALALCYQKINHLKPALRLIKTAVRLNSNHPNYINRYCKILIDLKDFSTSVELMSEYLKKNNRFPEGYITLSIAWNALDKPYNSSKCLIKACKLFPGNVTVQFNLADALLNLNRYTAARKILMGLIRQNSLVAESYSLLSAIERDTGNYPGALIDIEKAFEISPDKPAIQWNYALLLLLLKKYNKGWPLYDSGIVTKRRGLPDCDLPRWQGESLQGKTLLIIGEQGLGDQIMFASQLNILKKMNAKIILTCDKRLLTLFKNSFPYSQVISQEQLPSIHSNTIDYMIPTGSLPGVFNSLDLSIVQQKQYLIANDLSNKKDQSEKGNLKVGFSWKGGASLKEKRKRSIALSKWGEILSHKNIDYICLQHNLTPREQDFIQSMSNITVHNFITENSDFDKLSETVSQLDLVISVDNTLVHLASGLGIETWCLTPFSPDWRWGIDEASSHWYKTLTLFRQETAYNWQETLNKIDVRLIKTALAKTEADH